jgi:hypothetical protein
LDDYLAAELGVPIKYVGTRASWNRTFLEFETRDFLDSVTLIYRYLTEKKKRPMHKPDSNLEFVSQCSRIFAEEGLRYEFDSASGVHFKVDAEFAASTSATITALGLPRYANAKVEFEKGIAALSSVSVDGKEGIRGIFSAAECIYKLMVPKAAKLTSADAIKSIQGILPKLYVSDPTALRAANKVVNAFGDWVDACHNYRHEDGVEEPSQPPIDLAVSLIGLGSGHLRWLISVDQAAKSATAAGAPT